MIKVLVLLAVLCSFRPTVAQSTLIPSVSTTNTTALYGNGLPQSSYTASAVTLGKTYVQLDALPGQRLWLCIASGPTYVWEQLKASTASTVTPTITVALGITVITSTYTGSVSNPAASVGMTARLEGLGFDPGNVFLVAWISTNGTINFRITNFSTTNLNLTNALFNIYLSHAQKGILWIFLLLY